MTMRRSPLEAAPEALLPAYVALRPARVGVFVPEVPRIPWHRMWEHALATQCRVWGGSANVPFPLDESLIDSELFWALADRLDPDGWVVHTGKLADLAELDPDQYDQARAKLAKQYADMPEVVAAGPINIALQDLLVEAFPPDDWYELLLRRTAALDLRGVAGTTTGDQHDVPPYPFTDALAFQGLPENPQSFTTNLGDLQRLLLTVEYGRFVGRSPEAFAQIGQVNERPLDTLPTLADAFFTDLGHFSLPLRYTEWGLDWYGRSLHRDALPLVVGSEPLDFTLFYALRRMRSLAYWLPDELADEPGFTLRLIRELDGRASRMAIPVVVVSATATAERCEQVLARLQRPEFRQLGKAEVGSWRDVLPEFPNRLYEVDRQGQSQPLVVQDGRTPEVASPLPRQTSRAEISSVHWISEVSVRDWQPIRHRALGEQMAPQWEGDPTVVRTSSDGIAYRCPPSATLPSRTLAGLVANPELRPLDLWGQVSYALDCQGWRAAPSDKGTYARESAALFGGFATLCQALQDAEVAAWLTAFAGPEPYGMRLKDNRRYVTYAAVAERFEMEPDRSLRLLEDAGGLLRGLVLKCRRCRNTAFYEVAELGREFMCRRCRLNQLVTRDSWLGAAEPPWQYGLAEVLFQLLDNNGQLPLLAAYETFKDLRRPFATAYELDLWPPTELRLREDEEEDKREVDLVVSDGYRLWVGEAGVSDHFGPGDAELLRLRELAQLADALDAYGVLAVTSQPALRSTTRGRLRTALDELRVAPLLREVGGIALWPELPPLGEAVNPEDTLDGN